jgi:cell division protein FtsB
VTSREALRMPIPQVVVESMFSAAEVARSYESLGIESLIQVQKNQERVMKALEEENQRLREENTALRDRIHDGPEGHTGGDRRPGR